MPVTDKQMAALKALLSGRPEEHGLLLDEIAATEGPDAGERYSLLIGAAAFEAIEKRFIRDGKYVSRNEVVAYVASVRSRTEGAADTLHPRLTERIILAALDQENIDDIDTETVVTTQHLLLAALVGDEQYSEEDLDAFLALVKRTADEWLEADPD
jgi:hypothetical protein